MFSAIAYNEDFPIDQVYVARFRCAVVSTLYVFGDAESGMPRDEIAGDLIYPARPGYVSRSVRYFQRQEMSPLIALPADTV